MKQIKATKVKDGWSVEIIETRHQFSNTDLLKLIKQNGMTIDHRHDHQHQDVHSLEFAAFITAS